MSAEIRSNRELKIAHALSIGVAGDPKLLIDQAAGFQKLNESHGL